MKQIAELAMARGPRLPEKVLQFGDGNFLRAFADWMIQCANEEGRYRGSVVICQALPNGMGRLINEQNGCYTVILRGQENGAPVCRCQKVTAVSRCIDPYRDYQALLEVAVSPELEVVISNTTEAGIAYRAGDTLEDRPPLSYPAKLCAVLYARYRAFDGAADKGLLILPVELIDDNGTRLKELVLRYAREWGLDERFQSWIGQANCFANTLVDRIVTGYPKGEADALEQQLGYRDRLMTAGEPFNLWVIEAPARWAARFPVAGPGVNVIWTDCVAPYKTRKVRILNGSHTAVAPAAYLAGYDTVAQFLADERFADCEHRLIFEEIIPSLSLDKADLTPFAEQVEQRFRNPFITHYLQDIQLNSCSKYAARCLPTILDYQQKYGGLPRRMVLGFAALLRYLRVQKTPQGYEGRRENGEPYLVRDDEKALEFFAEAWRGGAQEAARRTLANTELWGGRDLSAVPGLQAQILEYLQRMETQGIAAVCAAP